MTSELPEMRASDADRDLIAERLREGFAEGRLNAEEFEERLDAVYASRTRGELAPLVRDLPQPGEQLPAAAPEERHAGARRWAGRFGATASSRTGVAVMSGLARRGGWVVPRLFRCVVFWGGAELDLRDARYESQDVELKVTAIMGGIEITVPHDAEVEVNGVGIMGGFEQSATGAGVVGAPRIVVSGLAFWGGVDVKRRRPSKEQDRELPGKGEDPPTLR